MGGKLQLPTLSQGLTQMSDSYLQDLSIDSGGNPNFFKDGAVDGGDTHTVSMGPPPSRGWGGSLGAALMTRSHGGGSQGGGATPPPRAAAGAAAAPPGLLQQRALRALLHRPRQERLRRRRRRARRACAAKTWACPRLGPAAPRRDDARAASHSHQIARRVPARERDRGVESPRSAGIQLPGSAGRLVTGLTPHGMLVGTGLTPTGLTPGRSRGSRAWITSR